MEGFSGLSPAVIKDLQNPPGKLDSLFEQGGALADPSGLQSGSGQQKGKGQAPSWMNPAVLSQLPPAEKTARIFAYLLEEPQTAKPKPLKPPEPTRAAQDKIATFNPKDANGLDELLKGGKLGTSKNTALDGLLQSSAPAQGLPPGAEATSGTAPDKQPVFTFLVNPQSLKWKRKAVYAQAVTAATSTQAQQYYHTTGRELQVDGLLMETFRLGRSLRPILEQLQALLVPDVANQSLAPKVLNFIWGNQSFRPCVLTDINWTEKSWLNGEPATVELSLSLEEIPASDDDPVKRWVSDQKKATATSGQPGATTADSKDGKKTIQTGLTDRQVQDASTKSQEFLKANQTKYSPTVRDRIKSGNYLLQTDRKTGSVEMFTKLPDGSPGEKLGKVGSWDGKVFDADKNTLKKAAKVPKKRRR